MTISIKPTASGSTIEQDGSTVLSIESDRSVNIDSGTLHVDATNNRVGIGTSNPNSKTEIVGLNDGGEAELLQIRNDATTTGTTSVLRFVNSTANDSYPNGGFIKSIRNGSSDNDLSFGTVDTERMRINSSGNVKIANGIIHGGGRGINMNTSRWLPTDSSGNVNDNATDCGGPSNRFDDIYATSGVVNTSDQNEKQQIVLLNATEIAVAKRVSKLFKTFKWNSSVESKGSDARVHVGVIAQEVQQAFASEGLDVSKYGLWCFNTWWEKEITEDDKTYIDYKDEATEGYVEKTRLGIRYPELLSFVHAYQEQKLNDLETRIQALEAK